MLWNAITITWRNHQTMSYLPKSNVSDWNIRIAFECAKQNFWFMNIFILLEKQVFNLSWEWYKIDLAICFASVLKINCHDKDVKFQSLKKAPRNNKVCTLCVEFASQALGYLAENQTQTEVIDTLHQTCSRIGSFRQEVATFLWSHWYIRWNHYLCCNS